MDIERIKMLLSGGIEAGNKVTAVREIIRNREKQKQDIKLGIEEKLEPSFEFQKGIKKELIDQLKENKTGIDQKQDAVINQLKENQEKLIEAIKSDGKKFPKGYWHYEEEPQTEQEYKGPWVEEYEEEPQTEQEEGQWEEPWVEPPSSAEPKQLEALKYLEEPKPSTFKEQDSPEMKHHKTKKHEIKNLPPPQLSFEKTKLKLPKQLEEPKPLTFKEQDLPESFEELESKPADSEELESKPKDLNDYYVDKYLEKNKDEKKYDQYLNFLERSKLPPPSKIETHSELDNVAKEAVKLIEEYKKTTAFTLNALLKNGLE